MVLPKHFSISSAASCICAVFSAHANAVAVDSVKLNQEEPQWYKHPPKEDGKLYGVGMAVYRDEFDLPRAIMNAKANALADIAMHVDVSVHSRLTAHSDGSRSSAHLATKSDMNVSNIPGVTIAEQVHKYHKVWILAELDGFNLFASLKNDWLKLNADAQRAFNLEDKFNCVQQCVTISQQLDSLRPKVRALQATGFGNDEYDQLLNDWQTLLLKLDTQRLTVQTEGELATLLANLWGFKSASEGFTHRLDVWVNNRVVGREMDVATVYGLVNVRVTNVETKNVCFVRMTAVNGFGADEVSAIVDFEEKVKECLKNCKI